MKFHSKSRGFCAVIRPSGYLIVDGGRVHRPGIRAQFSDWRFDSEVMDWDPDPEENKKIREMVEHELMHSRRFERSRGREFWPAEDKETEASVRQAEKDGVSAVHCPWCDYEGKSDTTLTMHQRRMHPDKLEQISEQAAQNAARRIAAEAS